MRVLISDGLSLEGLAILRSHLEVVEDESLDELHQFEALIVRSRTKVTRSQIEQGAPRLQVIGRAGVGTDNIDLDAAQDYGVTVVNAPEAATRAVAEHALGLLLTSARRISSADSRIKAGDWPKGERLGTQLEGKTLGILGYGRIGSTLAMLGKGIGMSVIACDPLPLDESSTRLEAEPVDLQELLSRADFLSLHLPLNDQTRELIGAQELEWMKPSAFLINTARGGIIDEVALVQALDSGQIAGAALDVFEVEPPVFQDLIQHPRLIATPHVAAQTTEAQKQAGIDVAQEVLAALAGKALRWQVV
jgi:D-3-phosphoglycerate dehydrogenase